EDVPGFDRGGVYLCGNDVAESTIASSSPSAAALRSTYIPFSLTTGNHRPAYGVSPLVETVPGGLLDSWGLGDFYLYGDGDFDVMTPLGTTVVAATYGPAVANNAAVIANSVGNARVVLSGFSLISLRDDEPSFDRGRFQRNILQYLADFFFLPIVDVSPMRATRLEQNYPNPFNPATTIAFSLAEHGRVRVDVFTVSGQRVKTLVDEERGAGSYTDVRWDGTDAGGRPAASGVYFYRLVAGDFSQTRKMVLLK
ncbi:MAG TPA: T9SS type A sorting domain-containing protein, partial [Candidatus Krumholzibacteria bacterium]|nr:T9SS type A sorting domain-containing protein [Candidatus Krumholzibacteria bacterium]